MKNNNFPLIISITTSILVGYGFYALYKGNEDSFVRVLTAFVAFLYSTLTLVTAFVSRYESDRIKTVIGFIGSTFFVVGMIVLIVTMYITESDVWIILPIGFLSMLYLSVIYFISRSGQ